MAMARKLAQSRLEPWKNDGDGWGLSETGNDQIEESGKSWGCKAFCVFQILDEKNRTKLLTSWGFLLALQPDHDRDLNNRRDNLNPGTKHLCLQINPSSSHRVSPAGPRQTGTKAGDH